MLRPLPRLLEARRRRFRGALVRFSRDASGATAIEFGMVAAPFFLLMMAIMTVGLQFFTTHALDNGVAQAARQIRTGQAQKQGKTLAHFKQMICDEAGSYIKCSSKLVVHIKSGKVFADLDPPIACTTNGTLTPSAGQGSDPVANAAGTASATVQVTACYDWELGAPLWQDIFNLLTVGPGSSGNPKTAGKTIIQSTTTFRTEPYQ